jgi:exopolysaccharide biosynthesis polyprenyl glycosylphosphotransferase
MIPRRRQFTKQAAKVFDLCALAVSFVVATIILYSSNKGMTLAEFMAIRIKLGNCLLFAGLLGTLHSLFALCGLYVSKRLTKRRVEIVEVCKSTLLASALILFLAKAFRLWMVTPAFVLIFWVCCTILMVSGRLAAHSLLLVLRRRGKNSRCMLIVGTNERAIEFAQEITGRPELGYRIVGFVDDDWSGIEKLELAGHTRCCTFSGLPDFLRHSVVDEAAIYLPLRSYYENAAQLVSLCQHHGISLRFDTQIFSLRTSYSRPQDSVDTSQALVGGSFGGWSALAKRALDCVLSGLLVVLFAPLILVVAVLIKFTSPGPVFFRQTRVGLNKRQFRICKFRTMIANAEQIQDELLPLNEMTGPVFKIKKDPRVTTLGSVLRRTSIDELPQLLNVLNGDMSLVGPRAMSLRDYQLFDQDWQRRRFSVKPGITCLWQVNGRNSVPFDKWMELDMQYIDKWSLWLDVKILARTVPAVLRGTGAA